MISQQLAVAFIAFAAATLFTPGPNNIMLMASGLNYGFRRTLPHVAGVTIGFSFLVAVIGLGLGAVFAAYPVLHTILKYAGAAYLIYLAIVIAMSGPADTDGAGERKPMRGNDHACLLRS
jgi:threonine/homoserine/homoserine lactone efflux protein